MSEEKKELPFVAVGWTVIVKPFPPKTETDGGLALPDETVQVQKHNEYRGEVVSKGPLAYRDPVQFAPGGQPYRDWCEVGDTVAFNKYGGHKMITKDGDEYRVLLDKDILANITDPSAMLNPY